MTKDEKEIEKAKSDIEKKGPDEQTEKDRVDESVAAQERADGETDSQSAKDRVDESEGAEKADEKRAEDDKAKEDGHDRLTETIVNAINSAVESAVTAAVDKAVNAAMSKAFDGMSRKPEEADDDEVNKLNKLESIYGE